MRMQPGIHYEKNRFYTPNLKHAPYTKNTLTKALAGKRITRDDVRLLYNLLEKWLHREISNPAKISNTH